MHHIKEKFSKGVIKVASKIPGFKKGLAAAEAVHKMGPKGDVGKIVKRAMRGTSTGYMIKRNY